MDGNADAGVRKDLAKDLAKGVAKLVSGAADLAEAATEAASTGGVSIAVGAVTRLRDAYARDRAQRVLGALVAELAVVAEQAGIPGVQQALDEADVESVGAFLDLFHLTLEAIDPAVIPILARLAAPYVAHNRARDRFFRRVGRMLVDADASQLEQLRRLADTVGKACQGAQRWPVRIRADRTDSHTVLVGESAKEATTGDGDILDALKILAANDLASDVGPFNASPPEATPWVRFLERDEAMLRRLVTLFT